MILTNFLYKNASISTHTILSPSVPASQREWILKDLQARGANSINIYLLNQGDYGKQVVCPFARGKWFEPEIDLAELNRWESIIQCCVAMGLQPIFWCASDDSPAIADGWAHKRQAVANIIMYYAARFDRYALAWIIGLECNEWSNYNDTAFYGSILAARVQHPVGVHQTTGRWDYVAAPCFYFMMLQYGFGPKNHTCDPKTVAAMTRQCIAQTGKPVIACEYSRFGESSQAAQAGQAAIAAGASGVCNGW